jgi:protease-4
MKNNKRTILIGCLVFPIVLIIVFLVSFSLSYKKMNISKPVPSNAWLMLDLSGGVPDYSELNAPTFMDLTSNSSRELADKITAAAHDKRIKGIFIKPTAVQINMPNLSEVGRALDSFKQAKKPVLAYGEMMGQGDYLLATYADSIWINPTASGGIMLDGVSANILFYKEALQKLGIKMHVMQEGDFKGAGEPFTRTDLSPGTRENLEKVLKSRYDMILDMIAARRKITPEQVQHIYEEREELFITGDRAVGYGLVDKLSSFDAFKQHFGITEDNALRIKDYKPALKLRKSQNVAVINLIGDIKDSGEYTQNSISLTKLERSLKDLEDDKSIKAVVLRVNSPGGSALESEFIYQRLMELKKKYPLVVWMGGTAASGGYYISCAADYIMADPACITGSIGVIMAVPETKELGDKLGLRSQTLRYGKFAGAIELFNTYEPTVLDALKQSSSAVYTEFKQRVSDSRKIPMEEIPALAEGRVFSAEDALKLKLIDAIGNQDDAIKKAAALAKITEYGVVHYPQKVSFFELLKEHGFFSTLTKLTARNNSPEEMLHERLEEHFSPDEWLYRCPWNLH